MSTIKKTVLASVLAMALSACGNFSDIDNDGNIKGELRWYNTQSTTFNTNGSQTGFYPSDADMLSIHLGMSKAAVYQKFGHPQFNEGFFRVREWTYIHNRMTPEGLKQCQFKFVFDKHDNLKSFHWQDASCAIEVKEPQPQRKNEDNPIQEAITLSDDFTFDFDSANLTQQGRNELDNLISRMNQAASNGYQFKQVSIVGHTDHLGDTAYNQKLSQDRAVSVARYLTENGNIPINVMQAWGAGEAEPIKECEGTKPTPQLKECLRPNRRVVINVN